MASGDRRKRLSGELPKRLSARPNPRLVLRVGRNEPCPCGSGKKYKDCHLSAGEEYLSKLAMDRAAQEEKARGGGGGVVDWLRRWLGR